MVLCIGSLEAAPKVELEDLSAHIGEEVSVTGEVKAISRSPRTGVGYLSFGDAYPRQKLSAKVGKELAISNVVGLTVEVTGRLEKNDKGPFIQITDDSQLRVIPAEPGKVLEEDGEGKAYAVRLESLLCGWLAEGKEVRIFTARVWPHTQPVTDQNLKQTLIALRVIASQEPISNIRFLSAADSIEAIREWCRKHIGQTLPIAPSSAAPQASAGMKG